MQTEHPLGSLEVKEVEELVGDRWASGIVTFSILLQAPLVITVPFCP